jgi:hypothetical protein
MAGMIENGQSSNTDIAKWSSPWGKFAVFTNAL